MYQKTIENNKKKTISISIETFKRLEAMKSELIKERTNPNLTYDEVISSLLNGRES
jgi:predicted CopG family antitoxin